MSHPAPSGPRQAEAVPPLYTPQLRPPALSPVIDAESLDWRQGLLVRSTNWLGDAMMTLPAVYRLRQLLPEGGELMVSCPAKLASLWESVPWVDRVLPFAAKRLTSSERQALCEADPGLSVVLPNSFGSAWDLWRAGLPNLVGRRGRGRTAFLTHRLPGWTRVPGEDHCHQVSEYLEVATACGATSDSIAYPPLTVTLSEEERQPLCAVLDGQPLLVLAPGAAFGPAKQWPITSYRELARWWGSHDDRLVVAVGAPGEEAQAAEAIEYCPNAINLAGQTSLRQLMLLLQESSCIIANDSGTMHLGAALGKQGVAIFGSTDPVATGPLGGRWLVLREPLPCSPCLERVCPRTDAPYECLRRIQPSDVKDAVRWLQESS